MKPCRHRSDTTDVDCLCSCPSLMLPADQRVHFRTCERCPYVSAPSLGGLGDLFERGLSAIGITKKRVQKITGRDCGCSGRQAALNRLVPLDVPESRIETQPTDDTLQFVWVYWHRGAAQDELRFSIRSVEKNYQGTAKITIIGDSPLWYTGHHIPQSRKKVRATGFELGLRDVLSKMDTLSRHPDIDDEFIWMMDDVFMVRPTTRGQLVQPRAAMKINPGRGNRWRRIKGNTARRLARNGHTQHDYGTHLPHHVEKKKLLEMFAVWKPLEHVFLWEVAYGNIHKQQPSSHIPFLQRLSNPVDSAQYNEWASSSHFFNLMKQGWNVSFRNWLIEAFPSPSAAEDGAGAVADTPPANEQIDDYYLLIQSSYDTPELSLRRLEISAATAIPALTAQTARVKLIVSINKADPFLAERQALFESTGHAVSYVETGQWDLPVGPRNLVGRLDDDDVIPVDFVKISREKARLCAEKGALIWPNGYVHYRGKFYRWNWPGNQFVALVSRDGSQPYDGHHQCYSEAWPTVVAEESRGWVWVRHDSAITGTRRKYLKTSGGDVNFDRFTSDFAHITEVMSGQSVAPTDAEVTRNIAGGAEWRRPEQTVEGARNGLQGLASENNRDTGFDAATSPEYTITTPADSRRIEVTT